MEYSNFQKHIEFLTGVGDLKEVRVDLLYFLDAFTGGDNSYIVDLFIGEFFNISSVEEETSARESFMRVLREKHPNSTQLKNTLHRKRAERIKNELMPYLEDKSWKFLDYGCGDGIVGTELVKEGYQVYGCDTTNYISPESKLGYIELSANAIDSPNTYFDFAFANSVLHHATKQERVLREIGRVTSRKICIIEDILIGESETELAIHRARTFLSDYFYNRIFIGEDIPMPNNNRTEEEWLQFLQTQLSPTWKVSKVINLGWSTVLKPILRKMFILNRTV